MGNTPPTRSPQRQSPPPASASPDACFTQLIAPLGKGETRVLEPVPGLRISVSLVKVKSEAQTEQGKDVWCFITDGLQPKGQQEVVVLLLHEPHDGQQYPDDVVQHLLLVCQCACKGMFVSDGGYTELGGKSFLGGADNAGFVYTRWRTQPIETLPLQRGASEYLFAVLVKRGEVEWAKYMSTRLLLRLGHHHRFYPCPLWGLRNRPSLFPRGMGETVVAQTAVIKIDGICIQQEQDGMIQMRIPKDLHDELKNDLGELCKGRQDSWPALTLLATINMQADAHLVHVPGSQQATAISAFGSQGKHIGGSFVTFLPIQEVEAPFTLMEDGWFIQLNPITFQRLLGAIDKQEEFAYSHPSAPSSSFKLLWYTRSFINPVTGQTITATEGWTAYGPQGDTEKRSPSTHHPGDVTLKAVTLLTEDSTLGRRISSESLAGFVDALCRGIRRNHAEWLASRKEGTQHKQEAEKEKETKQDMGAAPVFVLASEQELILQVDLDTSRTATFKAVIGVEQVAANNLLPHAEEWRDFLLSALRRDFVADDDVALPDVTEGAISFLLHFQQPRITE